jgi:serine protease Do
MKTKLGKRDAPTRISLFYSAIVAATISIRVFALEADEVYAKVAPSIVVVIGISSSDSENAFFGSGVIIAPGQIVTNCHVVQGADVIRLRRERIETLGIVRYSDPDRDLCQIGAIDRHGFEHAVPLIPNTEALRVGQKVYAIGAPQGLELTLSNGLISSLRSLAIGTVIQTNAQISKGSSGGGLFDSNGRLIGITSFIFKSGQNLNFAVPTSWISELPDRHARREAAEATQWLAEEPKREQERKERAAIWEKGRLQQEALRKQREAEDAKNRAGATKLTAHKKLIETYMAQIRAKVLPRIRVPDDMKGNPEGMFEVTLLPGGEVLDARLLRSSGVPAYDNAVERAIVGASPLPVPGESDLFQQEFRKFKFTFKLDD